MLLIFCIYLKSCKLIVIDFFLKNKYISFYLIKLKNIFYFIFYLNFLIKLSIFVKNFKKKFFLKFLNSITEI
ncbi:hypothetical protein MDPP_00292 [Candidatus Phytoplasma pini]|uniref:Uncharacterized protein n=1 Tax=Candidatus Phytoplasma pini TaxID=267362 RepID=A0A559KJ65_9MOLU|nr:hypothetical protein MDPP_00292 [Candidatus Phytoplasma pini]